MALDYLKQPLSMLYLSSLKYLLEDIVSELIFGELDALLQQGLEDCAFGVALATLDDGLDCPWAVLVAGPFGCLVKTVHNFLLWR